MKRYGLILFLIFIFFAMVLFSEKGIRKIKGMLSKENKSSITDTDDSYTNCVCNPCNNCKNCMNGIICTDCESCEDCKKTKASFTIVLDAGHGASLLGTEIIYNIKTLIPCLFLKLSKDKDRELITVFS